VRNAYNTSWDVMHPQRALHQIAADIWQFHFNRFVLLLNRTSEMLTGERWSSSEKLLVYEWRHQWIRSQIDTFVLPTAVVLNCSDNTDTSDDDDDVFCYYTEKNTNNVSNTVYSFQTDVAGARSAYPSNNVPAFVGSNWNFFSDVPNKPGWIGNCAPPAAQAEQTLHVQSRQNNTMVDAHFLGPSPENVIVYDLNCSLQFGKVHVGFLRSTSGAMGFAMVTLYKQNGARDYTLGGNHLNLKKFEWKIDARFPWSNGTAPEKGVSVFQQESGTTYRAPTVRVVIQLLNESHSDVSSDSEHAMVCQNKFKLLLLKCT
jgi:hypothetical protein